MRNLLKTEFIVPIILMLLTACASTPITPLPANANPFTELSALETDIKAGREEHLDVLSGRSFKKAVESQNRARDLIAESRNPEPILANLARGFHFLRQARANALKNGPYLRGVLVARKDAMHANAQENPRTAKRFAEADEDVRDDSDNAHKWSIEKLREAQSRYRYLELMAITANKMGGSLSQLEQSQHRGAKSIAPDTLKRAQVDYLAAEDAISANRRNEEAYEEEVKHATHSTAVLFQVVEALKQSRGNIDEPTAVKLATQDEEIKDLKQTVAELKARPEAPKVAANGVPAATELPVQRVALLSAPAESRVEAFDETAAKTAPAPVPPAPPRAKRVEKPVPKKGEVAQREELQSADDKQTVEHLAPPPSPLAAVAPQSPPVVAPAPIPEIRPLLVASVPVSSSGYDSTESRKRRAEIEMERQKLRERELALEKDSPQNSPAPEAGATVSMESRKVRADLEAERRKLKERELALEAAPALVPSPTATKGDVSLQAGTPTAPQAAIPQDVMLQPGPARPVVSAAPPAPATPTAPLTRPSQNEKPKVDFELERQKLELRERQMAQEDSRRDLSAQRGATAQRYTDASALQPVRTDAVVPVPVFLPPLRDDRAESRSLETQRRALEQREAELRRDEDAALSRGRGKSYSPQFEKERLALERRERDLMRDQDRSYELNREVEKSQEKGERKDMRQREKRIEARSPMGSCSFQREDLCGGGQARPLTRQAPQNEPGWKMDKGNLIARSPSITE